jgi:hypothetical protein
LSRAFVAQAEYYFDTSYDEARKRPRQDPDQWMWNMSWRARLRRFRLPRDGEESSRATPSAADTQGCAVDAPAPDLMSACSSASAESGEGGAACPDGSFLEDLRDLAETVLVH